MENSIQSFISAESQLTLCTVSLNAPYCASCFYAYMQVINFLIIKSDRSTKHIQNALENNAVAGTITPGTHKAGVVKGIQFTGKFLELNDDLLAEAKKRYFLKHPVSIAMHGDFWAIELHSIKMIDSTLGFGKKLKWEIGKMEKPEIKTQ
ncbi:MAG: hypothetical protein IPP32_08015 [Bacteroidetes bacterium]|nr:hypothetical protein [Bacteroidota bacterium]